MNEQCISLIIPCYNASATIEKCLQSVVRQSYHNLEIIVVNDGSTDNTLELIQKFQDEDQRITVINQTNSGVSKARNQGIAKASGSYICFVDSDDWVEDDYCFVLHQSIIVHDADISIAEAFYEDENGDKIENIRPHNSSISVYDSKTALQLLLEDKLIQSHPWAKLYKSELLKNVSFPENLEAFEDYYTIFKVFNNAKKVVKTGKPIYHYVQFENSLSHNLTPRRAYHFFLALMEAYTFVHSQQGDSAIQNSITKNILRKCFMVLKRILRNTNADEMLAEKEEVRLSFIKFMGFKIKDIGLEYYLYIRLYYHYPNTYARMVAR